MLKRNVEREFSEEVKKKEWLEANKKCRICGCESYDSSLQNAHILSVSLSKQWERKGSPEALWKSNEYVSSQDNCILLCKQHHDQCDSKEGLLVFTVNYLLSLKTNMTQCSALITKTGRKCINLRRKDSTYCEKHTITKGGIENTITIDSWRKFETLPLLKSVTSGKKIQSFSVVKGKDIDQEPEPEHIVFQKQWLDALDVTL